MNNKIIKYKQLIRTTLGEFLLSPFEIKGIYIIACYPTLKCLYIGIAEDIYSRIREHFSRDEHLSNFLKAFYCDSLSFRLDILVPPNNGREWMIKAEKELIQYFRPAFNNQHLGENS